MRENNKKLVKTILISGFGVLLSYAINLLLTPYITERLGIEAYGFISISKNMVGYAGIITVALTSFTVRFISVSYHEGKLEEAQAYYSSTVVASVALSAGIFICMLAVIWKLEFVLNIPEEYINSVKLLFVIVFLNFVLTTVVTPVGASAYIKNRLDLTGLIKVFSYICDACVLLILFGLFSPRVWYVGIGSASASLVTLLCTWALARKLTPELRFQRALVSFEKVKKILQNGMWNSLNSLGNTLNSGLDLWISNLMLSGVETGQIAVVKTINTLFSTLYQVVFQPFQPQLLKSYANDGKEKFINELKKTMKICGYFSNVAFAGFLALGHLYFKLWLPEQDTDMLYQLGVLTVLGSITAGVIQPVYYVNTLTLKNRLPCWITIAGGFLNVGAMYFALRHTSLGAYAVVGTTTVIMLCINLFFNPVYSAKCLDIHPMAFYEVIVKHILSAVIMVAVMWGIAQVLRPTEWMGLILTAILMCVVGAGIHIIVLSNREEWKTLLTRIKKWR